MSDAKVINFSLSNSLDERSEGFISAIHVMMKSIARVCYTYELNSKEISSLLNYFLVEKARQEMPGTSDMEISARLHIDRRVVKKYKDASISYDIVESVHKKVYDELRARLNRVGARKIKKHGDFSSFDSLCKDIVSESKHSPHSIAGEFLRKKLIADKGEYFEIISDSYISDNEQAPDEFIVPLARSMQFMMNSACENFENGKNGLKRKHRNIWSTQVPYEKMLEVHNDLAEKGEMLIDDAREILESREDGSAQDTYAKIGLSVCTYMMDSKSHLNLKEMEKELKDDGAEIVSIRSKRIRKS